MTASWALLAAAMRAYDAVHHHLTTCQWCGATWDMDDGYECRWCAEALERMQADQKHRLLHPDWAQTPGERYDELCELDKAVWDHTRGIVRGSSSVEAWTKRLLEAVDVGIVTAAEADAALDPGDTNMMRAGDAAIAAAKARLNGHVDPDIPKPVDWHELFARDRTRDDWLITDLWPRGRQISLTAPRKERKSLLMLYLAASLATGREPWSRRPITPIPVVYLDFEMNEDDLLERLEDMEFGPDQLDNLHYFLTPDMPMLDQPEGGKMLLEVIDAHQAQAVVIDTFSRVISTRDYTGHEVREFYRWSAQHVKARGVSLARLDHTGHTVKNRAAGSSAKGADVDVGWVIHKGDDQSIALRHHGLSRLGWVAEELDLVIHDDPLRFGRTMKTWQAGTKECADDLDRLGVPVNASGNTAMKVLLDAGKGKRRRVVLDAVAYRREAVDNCPQGGTRNSGTTPSGTTSGTTNPKSGITQDGNHLGYHPVPPLRAEGVPGVVTVGNHPGTPPQPAPEPELNDGLF